MASYRSCQRQFTGEHRQCLTMSNTVLNPLVGKNISYRVNLPVSDLPPTYKVFWLDYIDFMYKSRAYPSMKGFP